MRPLMSGFGFGRREASCPPSTVGMLRHPMDGTAAAQDQSNFIGRSAWSLQSRAAEAATAIGDGLMAPKDHHPAELTAPSVYRPMSTDPPAQFKPGAGLRASRARSVAATLDSRGRACIRGRACNCPRLARLLQVGATAPGWRDCPRLARLPQVGATAPGWRDCPRLARLPQVGDSSPSRGTVEWASEPLAQVLW
jgi:hypothetical protein